MFESLKKWFESVEEESHLFNHPEQETIHVALASVLYHIINSDHTESQHEKRKFSSILSDEFELNEKQVSELYRYVKTLKSDLKTDLETVNHYLKDNPHMRMTLMAMLNQLIAIDGIKTDELKIFHDAMKIIFPEIEADQEF